jgi:hypothetical protein
VRDLWRHQDLGKFAAQFHTAITRHGAVLFLLTPAERWHGHLDSHLPAR